ncbi:50S ribosome-binding GTPase [Candidatus Pacearchaeota archaeon]|nr:50S ribosome-binding GTPase [Candidatus Pacearchaeota archaeon]
MRVRFLFSSRRTRKIEGKNNHRRPYPTIAKEVITISDIILEVVDSRFIEKTRNIGMENLVRAEGKILIYVLNKADLVDVKKLREEVERLKLSPYIIFSCKSMIGRKNLRDRIKIEVKRLHLDKKEGTEGYKRAQIGIIGYPNTGKSSLINVLSGRKASATASEAGFTKGMHKIRFARDILILDTPGVIPEDQNATDKREDLKHQAEISVRTYDRVKDPEFVVSRLMQDHPGRFEKFYSIKANGDTEILLEELGKKHNFRKKGNVVDIDRAARLVLKDWQQSKI